MGLLISICDDCIKPNIQDTQEDEVLVRTCWPGGKSFLTKRKTSRMGNKVEMPYELLDQNKKSLEKRRPSYLH
jgi:hypothetical protein